MQPTQEQWRPVPGFDDLYEASSFGRVRSKDRLVPSRHGFRRRKGRVLSQSRMHAYKKVQLLGQTKTVHVIVAMAFLGPRPGNLDVCHNNGDPTDNRPENLRYASRSENQKDQLIHGTHPIAARTHCNHGHEFTPHNIIWREPGHRRCRSCDTARGKRRWQQELAKRKELENASSA